MGRARRSAGRRWAWVLLAMAVPVSLTVALLLWPSLSDRVLHPGRHGVSGTGLLPLERYATAGRAALGERVARIALPDGRGAVMVTGRRTVWLDPPTARVLGVSATGGLDGWLHPLPGGPGAMAAPAQPLAIIVAHARAQVRGGRLATIDWPTARNPDWTVTFAGGGRSVAIKVADDTGAAIAAPAR